MTQKPKKKRIFRTFSYLECDAFAAYLGEMSEKGWHFQKWDFGLIFEQGEPEKRIYAVEVFPDGTDLDVCPEPETEEYAEYCQAGGWKLIANRKKFCIFQQIKGDAAPIVTDEEHLHNIWKAELKRWRTEFLNHLLIIVLFYMQSYLFWERYLFVDSMLYMGGFLVLELVVDFWKGIYLIYWKRKIRQHLQNMETQEYRGQKSGKVLQMIQLIPGECFLLGLLLLLWKDGFHSIWQFILIAIILSLLIFLLVKLIIAVFRPSRWNVWLINGGSVFLLWVLLLLIVLEGNVKLDDTCEIPMERIPLTQQDYMEDAGVIADLSTTYQEGILGSALTCIVSVEEESAEEDYDLIYDYYESPYPWVINLVWKAETNADTDEIGSSRECAEEWGAIRALELKNGRYQVKYSDKVLILRAGESLGETQIQKITEKLNPEGEH